MNPPLPSGAPRWPVLLGLATLVLGTHLWLIAGSLPWWTPGADSVSGGGDLASGLAAPSADGPPPRAAAAPARALPVEVSMVRWVVPEASSARPGPAPVRPAQRLRPESVRPAAAAPLADAPATTSAETATSSPPDTSTEAAASVATELPAEQPPEAPAAAEPATPAEVADAEAPQSISPAPAPTDELLAAAPQAKPPADAGGTPASAPMPANPAPSTTLLYDIRGKAKGLSYSADAELRWQNQGSRYSARMEVSAFLMGSRVQTSEGRIGAGGLMPERFGDKRRGSEKATHFDPAGRRIRFSSNAPDAPWQPGAQDRLSVFLQLGALLRARPAAYPAGSTIDLQVAGTGGAEIWRFEVGSTETLTLPAGSFGAVRLLRQPRREHDSTVEIWLAPAHRHLPVRIRITDADGSQADQQLSKPPPPAAL